MTKPTYTTQNLWLASLALLQGIEILDITLSDTRRCVITLDNTGDKAWQVAKDFYGARPEVDLRDLIHARADLIHRIYLLREEVAA